MISEVNALTPQKLLQSTDKPLLYNDMIKEVQYFIATSAYQQALTRCLELVKDYPKVDNFRILLATSAKRLNRYDLAEAALLTVLKQHPEHVVALSDLGLLYHELDRFDESLAKLEHAFRLDSKNPILAKNLSVIYYEYGLLDKATFYCEKTLALDSNNDLRYSPALIQLAQGDYQHGWATYENRLKKPGSHLSKLQLPTPKWQGEKNIKGKILLLTWEQGFGDNIQFIRFTEKLAAFKPKKIYLLCPYMIAPLFQQIQYLEIISVDFSKTFDIPVHDFQISLPSLPFVLKIDDESQFWTKPYLKADKEKIISIPKHKIQDRLHVGICWQGGKQHMFDTKRSVELALMIPLINFEKISWYSLQYENTEEERETLHYSQITDLASKCQNFADLASAIAPLDLIISVDTAVAHLAGALGKPVWLLSRYQTEWRHPRGREYSPWYLSMRIIRQTKPGDWDSVYQQLETLFIEEFQRKKVDGT